MRTTTTTTRRRALRESTTKRTTNTSNGEKRGGRAKLQRHQRKGNSWRCPAPVPLQLFQPLASVVHLHLSGALPLFWSNLLGNRMLGGGGDSPGSRLDAATVTSTCRGTPCCACIRPLGWIGGSAEFLASMWVYVCAAAGASGVGWVEGHRVRSKQQTYAGY